MISLLCLVLAVCAGVASSSPAIERKYVVGGDAKCIDGSAPLYFIRKGTGVGTHKWHIFFQGGGWCFNERECFLRMSDLMGSSRPHAGRKFEQAFKDEPYLSDEAELNPLMYNWNIVHVHYCDGGSFASDTSVEYSGKTLHFRGLHNRRALISTLVDQEGMASATEVLFSGCSAGALGLYLGIDDMADSLRTHPAVLARASSSAALNIQIRGLSDSGFFFNFNRSAHPDSDFKVNRKMAQRAGLGAEYQEAIGDTFRLLNIEAGVPSRCLAYMRAAQPPLPAHYCMYPEYLVNFVQTPVFTKQSQFDSWQNGNVLRTFFPPGVNKFGQLLTNSMLSTLVFRDNPNIDYALVASLMGWRQGAGVGPAHGLYIHSCTSHCSVCRAGGGQRLFTLASINASSGLRGDATVYTSQAAFDRWYEHAHSAEPIPPLGRQLRKRDSREGRMHAGASSAELESFQRSRPYRLFVQNYSYPCMHCCKCQ